MHVEYGEGVPVEVEISSLFATPEELEQLKQLLAQRLEENVSPISIASMSNIKKKGTRYDLTFTVLNGKHFRLDDLPKWLHELKLVGWRLNAKALSP